MISMPVPKAAVSFRDNGRDWFSESPRQMGRGVADRNNCIERANLCSRGLQIILSINGGVHIESSFT